MPASITQTQRQFLTNYVLRSVSVSSVPDEGGAGNSPLDIWRDAKDEIDARINTFNASLKGHSHPVYRSLSEMGLPGVLNGENTRMMAAVMDYERASADTRAKAFENVKKAVAGFRAFISSATIIDLLDQNPLGITMDLRSTLETAFDDIEAAAPKAV